MIDRPSFPPLSRAENIVDLARLRGDRETSAPDTKAFQACADLHAYWQTLRGTRQMPARSEFDPRQIETALRATFVAEKVAPRVARIRVSGSVLNDTLGMDVRGMPITALFDPLARDTVAEAIHDLFAKPAMVVLELTTRRGFQRKAIRARMLLLPMSDAQGNVSRVVGCLDIEGALDKTPHRFKVVSLRQTDVTGDAPIAVPLDQEPQFTQPEPSYAFAESPARFRSRCHDDQLNSSEHSAPRPSKLRLVVDNDA